MTPKLSDAILIFAIFQIVFFIKFWIMSEDVKKINKKFREASDFIDDARIQFLSGNKSKAKEVLDHAFYSAIVKASNVPDRPVDKSKPASHLLNYDEVYNSTIVPQFKAYYESMNLPQPDFNMFKDKSNIPLSK